MEDKCPFCGAAEIPMPEGRFYYACGTYGISEEGRSGQCWKNELATLRALLEKVLPVIKAGLEYPYMAPYKRIELKKQAQALLPEIKRVMEEKG